MKSRVVFVVAAAGSMFLGCAATPSPPPPGDQSCVAGSTGLFRAAAAGDLKGTRAALAAANVDVDQMAESGACRGWTPLLIASANGHPSVVGELLAAGANPNVRNPRGRTALMFAARYGYADIVKDLLDHRADPDLQSAGSPSAIVAAGTNGHVRAVRELVSRHARIDSGDCGDGREAACVLVGIVMGTMQGDWSGAVGLNQPPCDRGFQYACMFVSLSPCLEKEAKKPGVDVVDIATMKALVSRCRE